MEVNMVDVIDPVSYIGEKNGLKKWMSKYFRRI
jgi:hypothetical protein